MNADRLARRLAKLGWMLENGQQIAGLVRSYQEWHGLVPDGVIGPQTLASIATPRFCPLPDRPRSAQSAGQLCKWQDHHITWCWTGGNQLGLQSSAAVGAFHEAWGRWASVCGIKPERVDAPEQADVVIGAGIGREAGPSGTLAWSELPCSQTDRQIQQRYDTAERWVIDGTGTRPSGIDLVRVACHEIGHAIGLPHQPAGNLMAPTYSTTVHSPQLYEIGLVSASKMYGPPSSDPKQPPVEPDPDVPIDELPVVEVTWQGRRGRLVWE